MISINLCGGLGNQLFQIAACYNHALMNNDTAIFDLDSCQTPNQGSTSPKYKDNIFSKLNIGKIYNIENTYDEITYLYNKIPYKQNQLLNGYFQSYKYFSKEVINDIFLFTDENYIKEYIKEYQNYYLCTIHIRRGDYLRFNHIHNTLNLEYYRQAISIIKNNYSDVKFFIISDDISFCKEHFSEEEYIYPEFNNEVLDFLLIKNSHLNINANSSFSLFASYLNNYNNIKIYPSKWFQDYTVEYDLEDKINLENKNNIIII
jgi:hypothetical protein